MRRLGFRIALLLWLLIIIATAVFWIRSYRFSDIVRWTSAAGWTLGLQSSRGQAMIGWVRLIPATASPVWSPGWSCETTSTVDLNEPFPMSEGLDVRFGGFGLISATSNTLVEIRGVVLPLWFILMLEFLPLSLLLWRRRRQARLIRLRLCLQCGYDLRASTTRCPECGTPIPAV